VPSTTLRRNEAGPRRITLHSFALPITMIGAIAVFVVPLSPQLLDILLLLNLTVAVVVLLTTLAIRSPQEFTVFPTILLTTTLTRLVLNVATTRLVLTRGGDNGLDAAGSVVRAFGSFVTGNQIIVGVILFSILVVIQFVVITQGATRISEVAARFTLDGLPGRQMAIDADLHAGLIDQKEAHRRRGEVYQQADFFGAMDGASRFVRGDAIAGVIILLVNIGGGLCLGTISYGMGLSEAFNVFTKLTIGDGLVSQVPAFLISLAAGLIVTRSSSPTDLNRDLIDQLISQPGVLGTAAVFLGLLTLTPLPKLPLLILSGALGSGAFVVSTRHDGERRLATLPAADSEGAPPSTHSSGRSSDVSTIKAADHGTTSAPAGNNVSEHGSDRMEELLHVDPLELEIGFRLIGLADPSRGGELLDRLKAVRQRVAREMGLILPQVRVRDDIGLPPHEYRLKIRGNIVGHGTAYSGRLLAVPPSGLVTRPDGRDGVDPVTGDPAVWIHADGREVAELAGCRVLEAAAVVAGHFGEIVANHAGELLTRELVERLLDRVRVTAPTLVGEVVPGLLRAGELQRVLQNLLRERVSIRDLETILETLAIHAARTKDVDLLTELVRRSLGRQITESHRGPDGRLRVVTLAKPLDGRLSAAANQAETRPSEALGEQTTHSIVHAVALAVGTLVQSGHPPVILTSAAARAFLKDLTHTELPRLVVLSQLEIPRDTPIDVSGTVLEEEPEAVTTFNTTEAFA
jgi:flagellar biosynthesis protein FlhA